MTLVLAIDTATSSTGLALVKRKQIVTQTNWQTRHNQTVELLPRLENLLESAGLTLPEVDAVAVTRGPGSYNGVRVGIANAKGLAFALAKPLIGISTLEAEARRFSVGGREVWSVLPLGHDYAVAAFIMEGSRSRRIMTEQAMTPQQLAAALPEEALVTGELPERLLDLLRQARPELEIAFESPLSRVAALGLLGLEYLEKGRTDTPESLQALYLRRPQITPSKKPRPRFGLPERGVIWDMDGVIIDSAELHFQSWRQALGKVGLDMNREQFKATFGRRSDDVVAHTAGRPLPPDDINRIARDKETIYRQMLTGQARAFPGVLELMRNLKESGFRQAVASSAPPQNVELVIRELELEPFIEAVVDGSQVVKGKPEPEVFLKAAAKLDLEPSACLVIEDAVAGVEAARRAGMAVAAVSSTHPPAKLAAADAVVDSMEELDAASVLALINMKSNKGA